MFAVLVHSISPRIHYVFKELLERRHGFDVAIYEDGASFKDSSELIKIQYLAQKDAQLPGFYIQQHEIMTENGVNEFFTPKSSNRCLTEEQRQELLHNLPEWKTLSKEEQIRLNDFLEEPFPVLFPSEDDLGFDFFAMAFWFLSRYEEYQNFPADKFGRFHYHHSVFGEEHLDPAPWVDIALYFFLNSVGIPLSKYWKFDVAATVDVDMVFRFRKKGFFRSIGGLLKKPQFIIDRLFSVFSKLDDFSPEKTIIPFFKSISHPGLISRVFILSSKKKDDINKQVFLDNKAVKNQIKILLPHTEVGLHPSFSDYPDTDWVEEREWLEGVLDQALTSARLHYIRLLFPDTYNVYQELKIKEDWSMGFAEHVGFRAGTSYSFRWYNPLSDKESDLLVHPFQIMDVTCKNYMGASPKSSISIGNELKEVVKLFGGTFCFIVHNESLSEKEGWMGWKRVFESWANPNVINS